MVTDKLCETSTTEFVWQGDNLVAELNNNENYQTYLYEPGTFKPLALIKGEGQEAQVFHYHLDQIGTPIDITDTNGSSVWSVQYRAYGNVVRKHVDTIANPLRFQGQYFDEETGLHYNRHRYYAPDTGRFITVDPIGLAGGLNNYQYVPNPTGWVDPLGLASVAGDCPGTGSEATYDHNMVENPGPLASLPNNPAANFASGKYNVVTLDEDTVFYRAGQSGGGRNALGQWFTRDPAESVAQVRIDLAVKPQWKDANGALTGTSPIESVYKIKIPKGTTIYEGPVGYQNGIYLGGQDQVQLYIHQPWNIKGLDVLGELPIGGN